jgi:DNA-binding IclR family transcriptional regulator
MKRAANVKPMVARSKDRQFVTALGRGLEVLRCFGPGDRLLGNQELARRTGLPKPTISRLTYTLTELGYLRYSETENKYALGTAVFSLGFSALGAMDVRRIARPLMQALAEHTGASVNLGVHDRLNMIYIDTYRNAASFTVQLDVGSHIPVATTSMGRAYLCALREDDRGVLLDAIRESDPGEWSRVKKGVEQALREYQEQGFCLGLGDWRREVHALAAPLVLPDGSDPMVFSCSGAAFQLGREKLESEIGPRLLTLVGNVRSALAHA